MGVASAAIQNPTQNASAGNTGGNTAQGDGTNKAADGSAASSSSSSSSSSSGADPFLAVYSAENQVAIREKGYKSHDDVAKGWREAVKHIGRPAEDIVVKPKEGDAAARKAYLGALGVPATPAEYGFKAPEGDTSKFAETAAGWLHELGIPKAEATALYGKWGEFVAGQQKAQDEAFQKQGANGMAKFKSEAGAAHDRQLAAAKKGGELLELTGEEADGIERAMGTYRFLKALAKLGEPHLEPQFVGGEVRTPSGQRTPEQARKELAAKGKDPDFMARLNRGDPAAKQERLELDAAIAGMSPADYKAQLERGGGSKVPGAR